MFDLTPDTLGRLVGIILSLIFGYFPWVSKWYDGLESEIKPLLQVFIMLIVAWGYLTYRCSADWGCMSLDVEVLFTVWIQSVVANLGTYFVAVRQVKQGQARRARIAAAK